LSKRRDESRLLSEAGKVDLFQTAYDELFSWCRTRDFAGHDPFDALNSRLFQATPLTQSRNARFIWTQLVKRSPIDVRGVIRVPVERNAKGVALFALAQLANYRRVKTEESRQQAKETLAVLWSMKIEGYSGAAWGYNFDWQSRNFFAPREMPTIVATAFAARALVEGRQDLQDFHDLQDTSVIASRRRVLCKVGPPRPARRAWFASGSTPPRIIHDRNRVR
jgi:hypothetical protein